MVCCLPSKRSSICICLALFMPFLCSQSYSQQTCTEPLPCAGTALNIFHILTHLIRTTNSENFADFSQMSDLRHRKATQLVRTEDGCNSNQSGPPGCISVSSQSCLNSGLNYLHHLMLDFPAFTMQKNHPETSWEMQIPGSLPQGLLCRKSGMRSRNL